MVTLLFYPNCILNLNDFLQFSSRCQYALPQCSTKWNIIQHKRIPIPCPQSPTCVPSSVHQTIESFLHLFYLFGSRSQWASFIQCTTYLMHNQVGRTLTILSKRNRVVLKTWIKGIHPSLTVQKKNILFLVFGRLQDWAFPGSRGAPTGDGGEGSGVP